MKRPNIFIVSLVIIMVILAPIGLPAFGQNATVAPPAGAGPQNPNANQTTAYQILNSNSSVSLSTLPPISVKTDLQQYNQGDSILMTGQVRELQNGTDITFIIYNPLKNMVSVGQLPTASDGSFKKTFLATGPLWTTVGNYTAVVTYGPYTNATASFIYSGGTGSSTVTQLINSTYPLQSGSQTYNIPYIIKGATVSNMNILASTYTLAITLNPATANGSITVTLPRQMIDAKIPPPPNPDANLTKTKINTAGLQDDSFIVTVGGKAVTGFSETKNQSVRILSIPFSKGDTTIDIVGTVIVPEFGPIAALVLVIAIISIIAVSAKTGLRFMPKY